MNQSTWAKIAGWAQFSLQLFAQVGGVVSTPGFHFTPLNIVALVGSGLTAVAVHGASNTSATNPTGSTTVQ